MIVRNHGVRWVGAVGAALALALWPTTAGAATSSFGASAEAYPFRTATSNPSFPLGVPYEGFGPYASANLTSLGAADAVAAGPYPGAVAVQGPGLVNSVTGIQVPNYPFYVKTSAGQEPEHVDNPFSALSAASGASAATAEAVMGSAFSGATARARTERMELGAVRASAESSYEVLELANNIVIRGLRSVASATVDFSGELTRTSLLEFDSITAPGLAYATPCSVPPQIDVPDAQRELPCAQSHELMVSFRDGQFLLSTPDGTEQATPVDAAAVTGAFQSLGVSMSYQEPVTTEDGIVAAGMTFSFDLPEVPPNESGVSGVTTQVFEIGFASASARAVTTPSAFGFGTGSVAVLGAAILLAGVCLARTRVSGE